MFWPTFTDQWLVSRLASRLLVGSAVVIPVFTVFAWLSGSPHIESLSFWQRLPWGIFGITFPIAAFLLFFGMWQFWMRLDHSRAGPKRVWFVILLFGLWWGASLYCLSVYLPQVRRKERGPQ